MMHSCFPFLGAVLLSSEKPCEPCSLGWGQEMPGLGCRLVVPEWVDSEEKWKSLRSDFPPTALTPPRRH